MHSGKGRRNAREKAMAHLRAGAVVCGFFPVRRRRAGASDLSMFGFPANRKQSGKCLTAKNLIRRIGGQGMYDAVFPGEK